MEKRCHEFRATRATRSRGFDIVEISGPEAEELSGKVMAELMRIPYGEYNAPALFLWYSDELHTVVAARVTAGERVDDRTNMEIRLRVPDMELEDAFEACLLYLGEDAGWPACVREGEGFPVRYGIAAERAAGLISRWQQSLSSYYAAPILAAHSELPEGSAETFACELAEFLWEMTPAGAQGKYSFAWNAPGGKCRGFRVCACAYAPDAELELAGETDVEQESGCQGLTPGGALALRLANESTRGRGYAKNCLRALDHLCIRTSDYDALTWNYCYWLLQRGEEIPCGPDTLLSMTPALERQAESGIRQAPELYAAALESVLRQGIAPERAYELLLAGKRFFFGFAVGSDRLCAAVFSLLLVCARDEESEEAARRLRRVLEILRSGSEELYERMIRKGVEKGDEVFWRLLALPRNQGELEAWLDDPGKKGLSGIPAVKERLLETLSGGLEENRSPSDFVRWVRLGDQIDRDVCGEMAAQELLEHTRFAVSAGDAAAWADYLLERESGWRYAPQILAILEEQYQTLADTLPIHADPAQVYAMIKMGGYLENTSAVHAKLLYRFCADSRGRENLRLLCGWRTRLPEDDPARRLAMERLGSWDADEAGQWFRRVDGTSREEKLCRADAILNELEERAGELNGAIPDGRAPQLLMELQEGAAGRKRRDVRLMVRIQRAGRRYRNQPGAEELAHRFWEMVRPEEFRRIRGYEREFFRGEDGGLAGQERREANWLFYRFYCEFMENGPLPPLLEKMRGYAGYLPGVPEFLGTLVVDWIYGGRKDVKFGRLFAVLRAVLRSEKELYALLEELPLEEEDRDWLLRKVEKEFFLERRRLLLKRLPGDLFWGGFAATACACAVFAWRSLAQTRGVPCAVCLVLFAVLPALLTAAVGVAWTKRGGGWRTVSWLRIAAGFDLWAMELWIGGLLGSQAWIGLAVVSLLLAFLGVWTKSMKKEEKVCRN